MNLYEAASAALTFVGTFFFLAGTVGMLRFPDVFTRLHALTKADNAGLGLIVAGQIVLLRSWAVSAKLLLVWLLVLLASATACHLIARAALQSGIAPLEDR